MDNRIAQIEQALDQAPPSLLALQMLRLATRGRLDLSAVDAAQLARLRAVIAAEIDRQGRPRLPPGSDGRRSARTARTGRGL